MPGLSVSDVLSRALSGAALTALPIAEGSSLARTFADRSDKRRTGAILAAEAGACLAGIWLHGGRMVFLTEICVLLIVAIHYADTARRQFGGLSGDLAGWFLVKTEFWTLAAFIAVPYVEALL